MKSLLLIMLLSTAAVFTKAQSIKGLVKDETGAPLAGATVTLLKDSAVVKLAITRADDLTPNA